MYLVLPIFVLFSVLPRTAVSSSISNPFRENGDIRKVIPDYFDAKTKFKNYYNATPTHVENVPIISYHSSDPACNVGFQLTWSTSVSSPVFAAPVIFPSGPEGKRQIFLSTFFQQVEGLGHDGYKLPGWPLSFEDSTFQGSPMLYDIDGDGTNDVGIVDRNGNLYWVRVGEYGQYLEDYHIQVPQLKIKRDWATGLDPKFVDNYVMNSMFHHKSEDPYHRFSYGKWDEKKKMFSDETKKSSGKVKTDVLSVPMKKTIPGGAKLKASADAAAAGGAIPGSSAGTTQSGSESASASAGASVPSGGRRLLSVDLDATMGLHHDTAEKEKEKATESVEVKIETAEAPKEAPLTDSEPKGLDAHLADPYDSLKEGLKEGLKTDSAADAHIADPYDLHLGDAKLDSALGELDKGKDKDGKDKDPLGDWPIIDLDSLEKPDEMMKDDYISKRWGRDGTLAPGHSGLFDDGLRSYYGGGGGFRYGGMGMVNDSNFVFVDPHVLGSPVLADVNQDGHVEVIVAVSYYFDKEQYEGKELDFDPSLYVAGGLACWDVQDQDWAWLVHLDLTTDKTQFKAIIYSTPTVADLDGDGRSEIVVGTSMGLLYMLDGDNGFVKRFFPMQFHQIHAQVAVADIVGGPNLEIIVADMGGTLAAVDFDGEVLWDLNLSGTLPHTPTVGDVDGDGVLDIAVVAAAKDGSSHLWVVRGDTGKSLTGYPMALPHGAKASAPVILADLHNYDALTSGAAKTGDRAIDPNLPPWMFHKPRPTIPTSQDQPASAEEMKNKNSKLPSLGLHMIVPSFDGHIYVIEGHMRCAERIDIGEHIYSVPLLDDVTEDGYLDLVVGTLNGQVHLLETKIPYHPLNTWPSFPKKRLNGFTHGVMGVSFPLEEKRLLARADVINRGKRHIEVEKTAPEGGAKPEVTISHGLSVTFDIWDTRDKQIDQRKYRVTFSRGTNKLDHIASRDYFMPGRYTIELPLHPPESFLLVLGMTNEHGQYYEDTVYVSMSTRFYVWLKYMLWVPAALLYVPLLMMRKKTKAD